MILGPIKSILVLILQSVKVGALFLNFSQDDFISSPASCDEVFAF